jgi:hypothetical protein
MILVSYWTNDIQWFLVLYWTNDIQWFLVLYWTNDIQWFVIISLYIIVVAACTVVCGFQTIPSLA